ncbi:MAG TPA: NAD(P)-binding protein, partial [Rectinemataceae bacterium]|nr:NAD(P)-binding protein [Rectinemataceae bacterium]
MPRYRLSQIALGLDANESELRSRAIAALHLQPRDLVDIRIERRSIDARDKNDIRIVYGLLVETRTEPKDGRRRVSWSPAPREEGYRFPLSRVEHGCRPIVVGGGPAGLFCALLLAEAGLRPVLFERGDDVERRGRTVAAFFGGAALDGESNIQFGEGGAG